MTPLIQLRRHTDVSIKKYLAFLSLACLLVLLAEGLAATMVSAQTVSKQRVVASYLYNFAKNIQWPDEPAMKSFDIALYGSQDAQLFEELSTMASGVKVRNLPITVTRVESTKALKNYHLIFVEKTNGATNNDIYYALEGKPVLLVTAEHENKQLVMINLLTTDRDRLRFEVNKSNIINHGLNPLPELILNGGTEIDVAQLYREGQASLSVIQNQLRTSEKISNELANTIRMQELRNIDLERQLAVLNQGIEKSDELIAQQNFKIEQQKNEIEKSKKERTELLQEMALRTEQLTKQQQQLDTIMREIDLREKRLAYLNNTIALQEGEINNQKQAIAGLDETVGAQKIALSYLWAMVLLSVLLLVSIFTGYTIKRRDNQRLAAHSKDLQIAKDRLAIAKRKAEDASEAKSEFLSLMSHELRTPLQAIIGYTEVVMEELKMVDNQSHINDLGRVITNSERLLKLINRVLDLAKIESGQMELDLTEIKLSSLINEALGNLAPLLQKSGIWVKTDVDDGVTLPVADPEKLLHILINLLGNTCKFAPEGLVTIKAFHEPKRIYISVADSGIGLSAEQQLQIFDPFKQVDSSTTRKFQGSGLGLSITRHLCEMMGGMIKVESELGQGATFIIDIPLPIKPIITPVHSQLIIDAY